MVKLYCKALAEETTLYNSAPRGVYSCRWSSFFPNAILVEFFPKWSRFFPNGRIFPQMVEFSSPNGQVFFPNGRIFPQMVEFSSPMVEFFPKWSSFLPQWSNFPQVVEFSSLVEFFSPSGLVFFP